MAGLSRVHHQVCKRIGRSIAALGLGDVAAYRAYLDKHEDEWPTLDAFCRISISRLCRDAAVFRELARNVLPALAAEAGRRGERHLRVWSAGCASGEEPFSVKMLWQIDVAPHRPGFTLSIIATDADTILLERARPDCCVRRLRKLEAIVAALVSRCKRRVGSDHRSRRLRG